VPLRKLGRELSALSFVLSSPRSLVLVTSPSFYTLVKAVLLPSPYGELRRKLGRRERQLEKLGKLGSVAK
jgi:hypothetical protein